MPFPDKYIQDRDKYNVFEEYAAVLNQTNIGANNNKFYIVQLLVDATNKYYVWTRWGRVGDAGQSKMDAQPDLPTAIKTFSKKFYEKSGNKWDVVADDHSKFVSKPGKYTFIEIENKEETETTDAPIGKLTAAQIEKGQEVLKDIEDALAHNEDLRSLNALSSQYYTLIPTITGRKIPPPITTIDMLREKEELLKFYLRMGFEIEKNETELMPITGIMDLPLLSSLSEAISGCCAQHFITQAVNSGKVLAANKAGSPTREMNRELYGSIILYTSNAIYKELNKLLRDENRRSLKKYYNYLRMFMEALFSLPKKEATLWRGISADLSKDYKVGDIKTWWGISSCTSDKNVAHNFMSSCGGDRTFLTIDTLTATDISEITLYSSEKESLLAPGTQLKVISSEKRDGIAYIHLQEVGTLIN